MEAEESATQYRELLDAATRTYDTLTAEKHSLEQTVMSQASRIDRMLTQAEARKGALRTAEEMLLDSTNEMAELRRRLDEAIEDAGKAAELVRVKERERRGLARKVEEADDVLSRETRALRDELERFKTDADEARSEAASLRARLDALVLERDASMGTNDAAAEELAASVVAHEAMRTELSTLNARLESASKTNAALAEEKTSLQEMIETHEATIAHLEASLAEATLGENEARTIESEIPNEEWTAEKELSLEKLKEELAKAREELEKADDAQDAAIEWARSAAKEEAEALWAAQVTAASAKVKAATDGARARDEVHANELATARAESAANAGASNSTEKVAELESTLKETRVNLDLARADADAMSTAAADLDAELTKTRASHAEATKTLKASHESTLATLTQELGPLRKRAEDAKVSLMTAGHNERRLRAQLREAEDRGARALSDLAAELRRAESTAVEKMMASEQNAAKADETNARLARELWESRQKYDRETKALSDELDKARRRAAEAIRERGPARRPGAETSNEVVNEAVIAELQRELEAEMKTSESAAAESARREGLTRRKLASLEARVAEANSALVIATKAIDEKDASLAASTTRVKSLEASLRKLEIKALKCEDIAAVERAEKADLLDVHAENESLETKVKELEGELTAIRSQCEAVRTELSDARESMAFLENEARDAAVDAEEARAGWSKAEALAGDSNLLNAEIHRLKLELKGAGERLVERESEIERYHDSMDEFTGNDNEQQRVKHHQRVKEQRDSLKKDVAGGKARLRRAEAALLTLCTATETQRAALMRDVRARAEDLDVAGESNRRLSGWAEGEKIEGGHETGDAVDESWDATVGFLAHLKLPLGL
jgi:chromosome segregation ATPase